MAVVSYEEITAQVLDRAIERMAVAARTCFHFGNNQTKIILVGDEELNEMGDYCWSLADMSPLAARDGRMVREIIKEGCRTMVLGETRKSVLGWDCGACGFRTCKELNAAETQETLIGRGPSCHFKLMNMNLSANAAAAAAHRLGLHCRVFTTLGMSALSLDIIKGVDISVAVVISAAGQNPFFDRHKYWTDEHWDEAFQKEFPTYVRGFIGAFE